MVMVASQLAAVVCVRFPRLCMTPSGSEAPATPQGEVVIRTIAVPADANANGDIFGGWLMSQMDLGGAILARGAAHCRVTTVAIDGMSFLRPGNIGDVVR